MISAFRTRRAQDIALDPDAAGVIQRFLDCLGEPTDSQLDTIRLALPPLQMEEAA